jgi:hypothetical protein
MKVRRRLAAALAVALLGLSVTWAHSGLAMEHMATSEVVMVCLAITETAATWQSPLHSAASSDAGFPLVPSGDRFRVLPARAAVARAGPAVLQVLRR